MRLGTAHVACTKKSTSQRSRGGVVTPAVPRRGNVRPKCCLGVSSRRTIPLTVISIAASALSDISNNDIMKSPQVYLL